MNIALLTLFIAGTVATAVPVEKTGHTAAVPDVFDVSLYWSPPKMLASDQDPESKMYVPPHLVGTLTAEKYIDAERSRFSVDGVDFSEYLFSTAASPIDSPHRNIDIEVPDGKAKIELVIYAKSEEHPVYKEQFVMEMARPKLIEGPAGSRAGSARVFKRDEIPKDVLKDAPPRYRQ